MPAPEGLSPLPIDALIPEIVAHLREHPALVIRAATGAGKTTRVPPALADHGIAGNRGVLMVEPRRLAARVAASRMAEERRTRLGEEVGYQVRFEKRRGPRTRILVVTEGIFLRYLQDDPFLERYGLVILDEFHERRLDSDLALALLRRVQVEVRPDLKIVVMSATLDAGDVSPFLGDAPVVESEGRLHPLEVRYLARIDNRPLPEQVADAVRSALPETTGDLLAFLPGVGEIRRTRRQLADLEATFDLRELYGDLPAADQAAVLRPGERPRVVLATNVAETSVTVEGITTVIDSGTARVPRLDPALGFDRLELVPISRASADQRAGRAGRLAPGTVWRLWTERQHAERPEHAAPEVQRVDLAGAVLTLLAWGEPDVTSFPWYEAPSAELLGQALRRMEWLGAVDRNRITDRGAAMVRLPLPPRLARLALEASSRGDGRRGALLAALLGEERSPRKAARAHSDSDVLDRLARFTAGETDSGLRWRVTRAAEQIERALTGPKRGRDHDEPLLRAVLAAFPDRVARRRQPGSRRGVMVGGKGVRLGESSAVLDGELFVCVEIEPQPQGEVTVRNASRVRRSWLEGCTRHPEVRFDPEREKVEAVEELRYHDLILRVSPRALDDPEEAARVLAEAAARDPRRALSLDDDGVVRFLARLRSLREWRPELDLPEWTEDELLDLLPVLCAGKRSFAELRRAPLVAFLAGALTASQRLALDREAPERIPIPTGREVELTYQPGRAPVLAARIQELFGLAETPRVAGGRVPVLVHLLAPNGRPQQITDDLASFWANTYAITRKELRARYPKHAWPEDPRTAEAESRPRRRK